MIPINRFIITLLFATLAFSSPVWAAADEEDETPTSDWLTSVQADIGNDRIDSALEKLRQVNQSESADWNNLMGFSLRKQSPPDLSGAATHYERALSIDPKHKGALEYLGELKLMQKDVAGAKTLQQRLTRICESGCEELDDLNEAIANYKD